MKYSIPKKNLYNKTTLSLLFLIESLFGKIIVLFVIISKLESNIKEKFGKPIQLQKAWAPIIANKFEVQ